MASPPTSPTEPTSSTPPGSSTPLTGSTAPQRTGQRRPPVQRAKSRSARDRHGRGLRAPLLPADLPAARSRAEQFDQVVLSAVALAESKWSDRIADVEFAVDEVPAVTDDDRTAGPEVVLDGDVPLARFVAPGVDSKGRPTKGRVVLYRRPLEIRAADGGDLEDLVEEVLTEQVSAILGESDDES